VHHRSRHGIVSETADDVMVKFEHGSGKPAKEFRRRPTGADIVQGNPNAPQVQLLENLDDILSLVHCSGHMQVFTCPTHFGLCYCRKIGSAKLENELLIAESVVVDRFFEYGGEALVTQLGHADIHSDI